MPRAARVATSRTFYERKPSTLLRSVRIFRSSTSDGRMERWHTRSFATSPGNYQSGDIRAWRGPGERWSPGPGQEVAGSVCDWLEALERVGATVAKTRHAVDRALQIVNVVNAFQKRREQFHSFARRLHGGSKDTCT